jgi:hypothetical protein
VEPLLARDFIDLKIDTERDVNGAAVAERLLDGRSAGYPWMTILDADGKQLITSDSPDGNIGCPVTDSERAWFMKMLRETHQKMTGGELAVVGAALDAYAKTLR